jgi:hypothetical protein
MTLLAAAKNITTLAVGQMVSGALEEIHRRFAAGHLLQENLLQTGRC